MGGSEIIPGDINEISQNGEFLKAIIEKHNLFLGNASNKCSGKITRQRVTVNGIEKSILDYIITSQNIAQFIDNIEIDDKREKVLTSYGKRKIESDHNVFIANLNIV